MSKNKIKNQSWMLVVLVIVSLVAIVLLLDRFGVGTFSVSKNSGSGSVLASIKEQVNCTCGCDYTLEDCEKFDPGCRTRPKIIAEVNKIIEQGKSEKQILAALGQGSVSVADISEDDDPTKGRADAPVTIIEFSDFQCSYCAKFYSQTLPQLEEEYVKTGKVKFVYRDFPLSFHQNAQKAAEAAECADEQDKFWEYHDLLFEKQNEWSNAGTSKFKEYAKELDLNISRFNDCLDKGEMASEVKKDFQDGQSYGVSGTPAFFVNGEMLSGAQPIGAFRQIIDKLLE